MNSGSEHELPADSDWEHWLACHTPALLLFARQQTNCEADAQDLVQDAIVESWSRETGGDTPPLGRVYATIRNRAIDLARRDDRRAKRETAAHEDRPRCWFDESADERERNLILHDALSLLPAIYRDVVTLKVWAGLTLREIGEALDIPANTAGSRYRNGLVELRKLTKKVFQ